MKCVQDRLKFVGGLLDKVAPDPYELWQRGGATMETVEIESGRSEVPLFLKRVVSRK